MFLPIQADLAHHQERLPKLQNRAHPVEAAPVYRPVPAVRERHPLVPEILNKNNRDGLPEMHSTSSLPDQAFPPDRQLTEAVLETDRHQADLLIVI